MNAIDIVYGFYLTIITFSILKIFKWILKYVKNVSIINKIPGLQMLPFIGNAHNLKKKHGILFFPSFIY
jgi:hypothetical protein